MEKNGFTLVELLAVIVILAVVMLIGSLAMGPVIHQMNVKSLRAEGIGMVDSAKYAHQYHILNNNQDTYEMTGQTNTWCYPLSYLHEKGFFEKGDGTNDHYYGSVKIEQEGNNYTYTFWITNGKFGIKDVKSPNYNINETDALEVQYYIDCGQSEGTEPLPPNPEPDPEPSPELVATPTFFIGGPTNPNQTNTPNTTLYASWPAGSITRYCVGTVPYTCGPLISVSSTQTEVNVPYTLTSEAGIKTLFFVYSDTNNEYGNIEDSILLINADTDTEGPLISLLGKATDTISSDTVDESGVYGYLITKTLSECEDKNNYESTSTKQMTGTGTWYYCAMDNNENYSYKTFEVSSIETSACDEGCERTCVPGCMEKNGFDIGCAADCDGHPYEANCMDLCIVRRGNQCKEICGCCRTSAVYSITYA